MGKYEESKPPRTIVIEMGNLVNRQQRLKSAPKLEKHAKSENQVFISPLMKEDDSREESEALKLRGQFLTARLSPRHLGIKNLDLELIERGEWRRAKKDSANPAPAPGAESSDQDTAEKPTGQE